VTATARSVTPFVFGKLPSHGDFVCRGLSPARRDRWDAWASAGLDQAAGALLAEFEGAYAVAPPWRFVFATDGGWEAGAFAPSLDRAGRRFPIVAGVQVAAEPVVDLEALAAGAEEAIYAAFAAGEDVDALYRRMVEADAAPADRAAPARAWTLGGERSPPQAIADARLDPALLVAALTPSSARVEAVA
jgi:type VI secretion system protein ImpM